LSKGTPIYRIAACFSVLLVTFLVLVGIKHSIYLYLIVLGTLLSLFLLETTNLGYAFHLLTGFFWGSAVLILTAGLLSLAGVLLQKWVLIIPAVLLLCLILTSKSNFGIVDWKFTVEELILFGFALISLISHVVSIRGFIAPILHDPINHATWAKQIFNTGRIDYFYSPGLHILSAFGMMVDNVSVATYVLRLTNLFNGLMFIPAYYFLKIYFNSKHIALIGASLFLIGHFPTNLFFTAGKNALILDCSFLLLLLVILKLDLAKQTKLIVTNLLVFVLILTHYPLAAIGLVLITGYIFFEMRFKDVSMVLGGCLLGGVWGLQKYHYQIASQQTSMFGKIEPIPFTISSLSDFLSTSFVSFRMYFAASYNSVLFYLGFIGFLVIGVLSIRQKQFRGFVGFIVFFILLAIGVNSISLLRNSVYIIYATQQNMFAILIYASIAICLGHFVDYLSTLNTGKWASLITMILLSTVVILASINTYNEYRKEQTNLNLVSANDIAAYQWIKDHVDKQDIILNNAAQNYRAEIVFGSEGGTWIPVFADRQVAMPFTEFSDKSTHEIFAYYQKILENSAVCSNYQALLDRGVKYYYQDSQGVFGAQIIGSENTTNLQPVYSESGVVIYKIQSCQ
jgi:hypothetical protein